MTDPGRQAVEAEAAYTKQRNAELHTPAQDTEETEPIEGEDR